MSEIVRVVLDCVHEDGGDRVYVRGVFPEESDVPTQLEGATRNVVSVFVGHTMDLAAFYIERAAGTGGEE